MAKIRHVAGDWLDVVFKDSSHYRYYGVSVEVFEAFLAAPSKGKFVWQQLRGKYEYAKL